MTSFLEIWTPGCHKMFSNAVRLPLTKSAVSNFSLLFLFEHGAENLEPMIKLPHGPPADSASDPLLLSAALWPAVHLINGLELSYPQRNEALSSRALAWMSTHSCNHSISSLGMKCSFGGAVIWPFLPLLPHLISTVWTWKGHKRNGFGHSGCFFLSGGCKSWIKWTICHMLLSHEILKCTRLIHLYRMWTRAGKDQHFLIW